MENKIQVNNQELMIKDYEGHRVVTMWDIARLHNSTQDNVRKNFKRNVQHLVEGEDYFLVGKADDFVSTLSRNGEVKQQTINRVKDIPVFTEAGYLLMTKPMTDDKSWIVQRALVNRYFNHTRNERAEVKQLLSEKGYDAVNPMEFIEELIEANKKLEEMLKTKDEAEGPQYNLQDVNKTLEILTSTYKEMKLGSKETLEMTRMLLKKVNIELPEHKQVEPNLNLFLTIEELAKRLGLYTPSGLPNKGAIVFIIKNIGLDYSYLKVVVKVDSESNQDYYKVYYSPEVIQLISDYLVENNYPKIIENVNLAGQVSRTKVIYR